MEAWQDIGTAPRDKTRFIGADATGKVAISYYMWPDDKKAVDESEVYSDGYGACGHDKWEPTHWQPLPAPPAVTD